MLASHILVLNSAIYAAILGLFIFFYTFIFPRKKISFLILLILISCLPLMSLLRLGTYESGDFSFHVMETMSFYNIVSQGNIVPVWGGEMNNGYGYPAFQFTYPLPFYLMSLVHFFGISFINSEKIVLAFAYLFSGIIMFLLLKKIVGEKGAFVGALVYQFAPYHFIDLHFRAAIGEVLAFFFLPLILYSAMMFIETKKNRWFFVESIAIGSLILSHPAISLSGLPVIFIYLFVICWQHTKRIRNFSLQAIILFAGVFLAAFYWMPVFYELRFTQQTITPLVFIQNVTDLLYSPWRYGLLFQGSQGQLAFLIGYAQLLIIGVAIIFLIKKKFEKYEKFLLCLSLILVFLISFMMLQHSQIIWDILGPFKNFQFTYRLHGILMFIIAIIAAIVVKQIRAQWFIVFFCLLVIFSTILNWGNRKNLPEVTDQVLQKQIPSVAYYGGGINQGITIWSDRKQPYAKFSAAKHLEIIKGEGIIKEIERKNEQHTYLVESSTDITLQENTLYFPGWQVFSNGKPQEILISQNTLPNGLITFNLPKGTHTIAVVFQDTWVRTTGKIITGVTLLLIGFVLITKVPLLR
jgi:hypothetical protein